MWENEGFRMVPHKLLTLAAAHFFLLPSSYSIGLWDVVGRVWGGRRSSGLLRHPRRRRRLTLTWDCGPALHRCSLAHESRNRNRDAK